MIGIVSGFAVKGTTWGATALLLSAVTAVTGFCLWVKYFPKSRFGKKLILQNDAREWQGFVPQNQDLLGKEGKAHTPLRPAGIAIIDGRRIDVVTRGERLAPNTPVTVIEVEGNRVVVAAREDTPGAPPA